jgi:hypothetical protein
MSDETPVELARLRASDVLLHELVLRLDADGRDGAAMDVRHLKKLGERLYVPLHRIAPLLVARLRIEGRGDSADALAALFARASIDCDPRLRLEDAVAPIERGRKAAAVSTRLLVLRRSLTAALRRDGHAAQANAVDRAWRDREARPSLMRWLDMPGRNPPSCDLPVSHVPPPFVAAGDALASRYPSDVLVHAAIMRLRADRRELVAGLLMFYWLDNSVGPIADTRRIAEALVAQLRAEEREALADTIESLLRDAPIGRDPEPLVALWLQQLASPMFAARPLAAPILDALGPHEGHDPEACKLATLAASARAILQGV